MLIVSNINFSYDKTITVKEINFTLNKGENLALIGESGCGKSTLLKLIYGLYDLDKGEIQWNNNQVLGPKHHLVPGMPYMKYLAQDFDLMPYITVTENVGKYLSNFFPEEKKQRIQELLEVVEMTEFANVKANFLSGGQMQRVAIAKVLAKEPELLLLDEPFSHIDNFRKNSLRRRMFRYLKAKNITCIVATHDVQDVLSFSDEVIVMKNGQILEKGKTNSIYNNPNSFYVASLFGEVNQIQIENKVHFLYPYQLEVVFDNEDFKVEVRQSYFRGSHYLIEASFNNQIIFFESKHAIQSRNKVGIKIKKDL
ncbi:ABC transporter ATP-binding protein [Flavobacterium sediminilitoris]|uniref:ABC transporter ATP-binding protein n=1 Tax=Flavobacterium sediminilitoris TaxID=2024526 RepID=A0ABY4HQA4_9FLAO|nr:MULTISPECIES: ABC transporter ATP-binding protein [Flavobacterium]UOX33964.1 ABC transporter ATP-binding protein [Flavobacterium sediminilitoris]